MKLIKNIYYFILVVALGVFSLLGVVVPERNPVSSVGNLQLSAFPNGLSLYQNNLSLFYSFSPYNDYLIKDDKRSPFISEPDLTQKTYKITSRQNAFTKVAQNILSYFHASTPLVNTTTSQGDISYEPEIKNNTLTLNVYMRLKDAKTAAIFGQTMSFEPHDFVFDTEGNLFTYKTAEEITSFTRIYGIILTPQADAERVFIPKNKIIIVNPDISEVITVTSDYQQALYVNRLARLIEVEMQPGSMGNVLTGYLKLEVTQQPIFQESVKGSDPITRKIFSGSDPN